MQIQRLTQCEHSKARPTYYNDLITVPFDGSILVQGMIQIEIRSLVIVEMTNFKIIGIGG